MGLRPKPRFAPLTQVVAAFVTEDGMLVRDIPEELTSCDCDVCVEELFDLVEEQGLEVDAQQLDLLRILAI